MQKINPLQILFGHKGWGLFVVLCSLISALVQLHQVHVDAWDAVSFLQQLNNFGIAVAAGLMFAWVAGWTIEILCNWPILFLGSQYSVTQACIHHAFPCRALDGLRRPPRLFF